MLKDGCIVSLSELSLGIMQGQLAELLMILGTGGKFWLTCRGVIVPNLTEKTKIQQVFNCYIYCKI